MKRKPNTMTIPRLELCGALLLAQTLHRLMNTFLDLTITDVHAWTDLRVVLSWLTSSQSSFKMFVTNRLAKISELIPSCQWHYVAFEQNPAYCVSRGLFPSKLINHELYWQGPSFLMLDDTDWSNTLFEPLALS